VAEPGRLLVDQLERVVSVAPFAQFSFAPRPDWTVTAGLRFDHYRFRVADRLLSDGDDSGTRTFHAASPAVGLTYSIRRGLNVYGNVATSYETPTTQELSNQPTGAGGFNPDLRPEQLRSVEGGVRGLIERWQLAYDVAGYASRLRNALVPEQALNELEFFRNAGESSRNGVEASVNWQPAPRVETRASYTYQRFRFVRFTVDGVNYAGKAEPGAPAHQLFASATYKSPCGLTSIGQVRWVDAYAVNNSNTVSNWAFAVVDLRFEFARPVKGLHARPFFGLDNALNERYNASAIPNAVGGRYFEPAPGRTFYVGLALKAARR
jgi:iron complex outermembrane receptor protein